MPTCPPSSTRSCPEPRSCIGADEQLKIGRWSLAANKVDRQQHIWVSPHLSQGEVITVYRDGNVKNIIDGLPVMETPDGFLYPEESQKDYILRWKYNA